MNGEILTPASPRWHDFLLLLTSPPFLDFHHAANGYTPSSGAWNTDGRGLHWFCNHLKTKPVARYVLTFEMTGIDADSTLAQWPTQCDCGLVFNVGNEEDLLDEGDDDDELDT